MSHAQESDFVFRRNGRIHLNRRGRQFSRLLAAEVCASAVVMVVMLDKPCSEVVWRVLATHSIRRFPLHFPSRASPCAISLHLHSTTDELPITSSLPQQSHGKATNYSREWWQVIAVPNPILESKLWHWPYEDGSFGPQDYHSGTFLTKHFFCDNHCTTSDLKRVAHFNNKQDGTW